MMLITLIDLKCYRYFVTVKFTLKQCRLLFGEYLLGLLDLLLPKITITDCFQAYVHFDNILQDELCVQSKLAELFTDSLGLGRVDMVKLVLEYIQVYELYQQYLIKHLENLYQVSLDIDIVDIRVFLSEI